MKAFIALFVVALAGQSMAGALLPRDTPEVEAAKAAHLARYNYEAIRNTNGYAPFVYTSPIGYPAPIAYYNAPIAYGPAPLAADGRVLDTPEVAAAKAAHFAAHAKESLKPYGALVATPTFYAYGYPYTAPIGADGNVVDTPEVAAAKAAHFAALRAASH